MGDIVSSWFNLANTISSERRDMYLLTLPPSRKASSWGLFAREVVLVNSSSSRKPSTKEKLGKGKGFLSLIDFLPRTKISQVPISLLGASASPRKLVEVIHQVAIGTTIGLYGVGIQIGYKYPLPPTFPPPLFSLLHTNFFFFVD